jgi:hypothetical protein
MNSPALAIGYMLWLRLRWGAAATALYLIGLAVAAHTLRNAGEPIVIALLTFVIMPIAPLLQVFTLGPADLGVTRSGYPASMFVLPVETRRLVGWPMLYAGLVNASLWILVARLVLMPAGFTPPIVWVAALIAASTAWAQAISWSPFPTPFARVPALALALLPLVLFGFWAGLNFDSWAVKATVIAASLLWMAVAYRFAVRGLSRARGGTESSWTILPEIMRLALARPRATSLSARRPFPTATAAQLWHECRRNAVFLPAMVAFVGLPMLALSCLSVLNPESDRTLLFGSIAVTPATMSLLFWLAVPLMFATSFGQALGKFDFWGKDQLPSFFAIRPLTTTRFVVVKLVAAAISALACCAILWLLVLIWAALEASPLNSRESLVRTAFAHLSPRNAAFAIGVMLGCLALLWRTIVTGMWISLAGRKGMSMAAAITSWISLTIAVVVGSWVYRHSEIQPRLMAALPWLLACLVIVKLCGAAGGMAALYRLHLAPARMLAIILLTWLTAATAILAGIRLVSPLNWQIVGVVLLIVPLIRIAISPVALYFNRHR